MRKFLSVFFILSFFIIGGTGKNFTINDVLNYETISSFRISPTADRVVWVQRKADLKENKYISHLWMASLNGGKPIQLTRGKHSEFSPRWSPDGTKIAFLSARDKQTQVYILNLQGGEPEKITSFKKGVNDFRWSGNNKLIVLAREKAYKHEKDRKKIKDDSIIVEDMKFFYPVRLFSVDLKTKKVKRLTTNRDKIVSFSVSPSGRYVVTQHITTPSYTAEPEPRPIYFLWDLKTGKSKEIFRDRYFSPGNFIWLDDDRFIFTEEYSRHEEKRGPGINLLYVYYVKEDAYRKIPLNWDWGIGGLYYGSLTYGGRYIVTSLANGARNIPVIIEIKKGSPDKWKIYRIEDKFYQTLMGLTLSGDGKKLVFLRSSATEPPQLYWTEIKKNRFLSPHRITNINRYLKKRFIARAEVIKWKSEGGREIEGILYYPKDYKEGKKYPLILNIHGGPAGYDADWFKNSWAYYPHYWANKGAFVLYVNYSGSSNYGLDFVESIIGHYYELEVPDILSGVDYLIKKGMVDPDKLATAGWSNGAILTIALIVETNRFKVAAPGAGDVNWTSDYGNCMFGPQFDELYFGGNPWDNTDVYIKKSPLFKVRKIKTPTIIFFGTRDTNVPTEQGWEFFRALKRVGQAPVKFILFPGEPHSLRKPSHQKKKMEEEIAWIEKYLFGEEKQEKPVDRTSRIEKLIALHKAKKVNGFYGIMVKEVLVPETVKAGDVNVSRFEITRAQFQEFLKDNPKYKHKWEPGTGNLPASGITFEEAQAYCKWLSSRTGETYRLPTEKEFKKLISIAKGSGNILDWWAGYTPNPEEVEAVRKYVKKHLGFSSLIKPVGSFDEGSGVYDIRGNLSEWTVTEEGKGKIMGLSVWHTSDKMTPYRTPPMELVGFRVVKEVKE